MKRYGHLHGVRKCCSGFIVAMGICLATLVPCRALAQDASVTYIRSSVDSHCGAGTFSRIISGEQKGSEDANLLDYNSEISDARGVIRLAQPCEAYAPPCEANVECDDRVSMFLQDAILDSEQRLRSAFASKHDLDTSDAALQHEFSIAVVMCQSPHLLDSKKPYDLARIDIDDTLKVAAQLSQYSGTPVAPYSSALHECALRISSSSVIRE